MEPGCCMYLKEEEVFRMTLTTYYGSSGSFDP